MYGFFLAHLYFISLFILSFKLFVHAICLIAETSQGAILLRAMYLTWLIGGECSTISFYLLVSWHWMLDRLVVLMLVILSTISNAEMVHSFARSSFDSGPALRWDQ